MTSETTLAALPEGADDVARAAEPSDERYSKKGKLKSAVYDKEIERLQEQLVLLQYWIQSQGLKVLWIFEGRGSAGKGGVIKRITERTSPRTVRVVALPKPTERQRTRWYFQRYVEHLPAAGEMVIPSPMYFRWISSSLRCLTRSYSRLLQPAPPSTFACRCGSVPGAPIRTDRLLPGSPRSDPCGPRCGGGSSGRGPAGVSAVPAASASPPARR